ncbi:OLC1v1024459C1 [Oldenlandia corymbosa var. corymbosa]|uniref:Protein ARV n=1 Tax=Oldenlandia corymbosa var. corymbosa TaxID=529605 RepID=A0AAV1C2J1_OLDCO|nr:OLC1v1024459C1 [Oldenlandia corymbosa var. corymbosa]
MVEFEKRLAKLELAMADHQDRWGEHPEVVARVVEARMERFAGELQEVMQQMKDDMLGTLNKMVERCNKSKEESLARVSALQDDVNRLMGELETSRAESARLKARLDAAAVRGTTGAVGTVPRNANPICSILQDNCKRVADEYIECELMIIVIDLILHKPKAYRHLFYNMSSKNALDFEGFLWGSILGFLVLDTYGLLVLNFIIMGRSAKISFVSLLRVYVKILFGSVFGNILFMLVILTGSTKFLDVPTMGLRNKDTVLAILFSSYFKIFLIATMVWEFPSSVILLIDMFVLSSSTVALKGEAYLMIGNKDTLFGLCMSYVAFFKFNQLKYLGLIWSENEILCMNSCYIL